MSKPEAEQWWFPNNVKPGRSANQRAMFVVGYATNGDVIGQTSRDGAVTSWSNMDGWHHEPRCTGWDWVVPEEPPATPSSTEDPDEWVVLDPVKYADHVPRVGVDQFGAKSKEWVTQERYHSRITVGRYHECCGEFHRCRRRDLPPVEQPKQWPKYYTALGTRTGSVAFVRRDSADTYTPIMVDGQEGVIREWHTSDKILRNQLTEAEAMALLKKPEPDHVPDASKKVSDETELDKLKRHYEHRGRRLEALTKKVRTLRRALTDYKKAHDALERERQAEWLIRYAESLPQKPEPAKTRVRLWMPTVLNSSVRQNTVIVQDEPANPNRWQEIHYDAEGFYVEKVR